MRHPLYIALVFLAPQYREAIYHYACPWAASALALSVGSRTSGSLFTTNGVKEFFLNEFTGPTIEEFTVGVLAKKAEQDLRLTFIFSACCTIVISLP
jgi:hypothetical protein